MKIVCTGHRGFIGSHLYKEGGVGIDIRDGYNAETCPLPKADVLFHLAGQSRVQPSNDDPYHDARQNILTTIRLLKHYKEARFIFASTGGAIQDTIESPYGLSKKCAEEYIKLLHTDYIILRLPNVYGHPKSGSVVDIFKYGDVVVNGDGEQTRDYVHVKDIVRAFMESIEWTPGTYMLGSGRSRSVLELAEATRKDIKFAPAKQGEVKHSSVDNTTPGWEPSIDVLEYLYEV